MAYSGGHHGFILHQRPKKYKSTPQQEKFRRALEACGIKRGITKEELMLKMKNCIPQQFRKEST